MFLKKQMNPRKTFKSTEERVGISSGNREKILVTALRLFTTQGVDGTPTAQISKEAMVSTGTLFHYFPDKNYLVDQLYLSIKKELAEVIRSNDDGKLPTKQRLEQCLRGYIAWGVADPEKARFLDQVYNYPGVREEVKRQAYDDLAPLPTHHSESRCMSIFLSNPKEITSPSKSTFRQTVFITDLVVYLWIFLKPNAFLAALKTSSM